MDSLHIDFQKTAFRPYRSSKRDRPIPGGPEVVAKAAELVKRFRQNEGLFRS
ncbi:hypothetical protein QYF49_13705 [Fictibacillus sp. CENA-BCM004]|uniref:Uncharacterized protein n=1 Tax=Fictibacillus terranigra TaxID=3058424 RepID=A0ABT8E851_9BACL|nr:hypothetical protein [Fictibacillus sp. CENA-BCM004]MDN4074058.1 hypothetical protein [Fictibacillus sp. CENA-BCM004]